LFSSPRAWRRQPVRSRPGPPRFPFLATLPAPHLAFDPQAAGSIPAGSGGVGRGFTARPVYGAPGAPGGWAVMVALLSEPR
jgi:hypothetical protein